MMKRFLAIALSILLAVPLPLLAEGTYPLGATISVHFFLSSPTTGNTTTADAGAGPRCDVFKNTGTSPVAALGAIATSLSGLTTAGGYLFSVVASGGNGFAAGDNVLIDCSTVVGGVSGTAYKGVYRLLAAENTTGVPIVDVVRVANTTQTAGDIIGDTNDIQSRIPSALVAGRMDSSVGAYQTGLTPLQPTTAGRTLDVTTTGEAGLDFSNIAGTLDAGEIGADAITAAKIAASAITSSEAPNLDAAITTRLAPTTSGRTLDVTTTGGAGIDWGNVENQTTTVALSNTTIATISTALASGTSDSGTTTTMVDAARTEADADYWKGVTICFTNGNIINQCRIVEDFNAGTDTITFAPAVTQAVGTHNYALSTSVSVWDSTIADHLGAGSTGNSLNSAASAGDPWSTAIPGAYAAGTAGYIVGNRLDTTVSTRLAPTVAGRTLDVTAGGNAGIDWANVEAPTTTLGLTNTTIATSQTIAAVSGAVGSVTGNVGGNVVGNVNGNVTGSVGSVAGNVTGNVNGSVGSVTGNVGGNVVGSVASVTGSVNSVTSNVTTGALSAGALAQFFTTATGQTSATAIDGSVVKEVADLVGTTVGAGLTTGGIADAVWDEAIAGHLTGGSTGNALNSASSAGDPWNTAIPGAYGAGTAGFIVGGTLNTNSTTMLNRLGTPSTTIVNAINTVQVDTDDLQTRVPAALTGGKMESNVGSYTTGQGGFTVRKQTAVTNYLFKLFLTGTSSPATGLGTAAITCFWSKDGATASSLADTTVDEVDATNMPGWYKVGLTGGVNGETDAAIAAIRCKASTTDAYEAIIVPEN